MIHSKLSRSNPETTTSIGSTTTNFLYSCRFLVVLVLVRLHTLSQFSSDHINHSTYSLAGRVNLYTAPLHSLTLSLFGLAFSPSALAKHTSIHLTVLRTLVVLDHATRFALTDSRLRFPASRLLTCRFIPLVSNRSWMQVRAKQTMPLLTH